MASNDESDTIATNSASCSSPSLQAATIRSSSSTIRTFMQPSEASSPMAFLKVQDDCSTRPCAYHSPSLSIPVESLLIDW